jgi:hypothetical protein
MLALDVAFRHRRIHGREKLKTGRKNNPGNISVPQEHRPRQSSPPCKSRCFPLLGFGIVIQAAERLAAGRIAEALVEVSRASSVFPERALL